MSKTVVGLFRNFQEAEAVVQELENSGFTHDHVSIVAGDHGTTTASGSSDYTDGETTGDTGGGVARGAAVGGGIGLVAGLIALAIPGIGPVLAAGPIAAALTGLGVGAAAGGVIGGLSHVGIPDEDQQQYASRLKSGEVLVTVHADDADVERAHAILHAHGAEDATGGIDGTSRVRTYDRPGASSMADYGTTTATAAGSGISGGLADRAEDYEHNARKDWESAGKGAWEETKEKVQEGWDKTKDAVSGTSTTGSSAMAGSSLNDRTATSDSGVRKDWESTGKGVWDETKEKVREGWDKTKDAVGADSHSDVARDAESGKWGNSDSDYRSHYESRYSGLGQNYDYYAPAYNMGTSAASTHSGRQWADAEPEIRRDWESKGTVAWDEVKDAVRHGWDKVTGR